MRRYSQATGRAFKRLKQLHQDEFFELLDEELPRIYAEKGPLPHE